MSEARIDYESKKNGKTRFTVVGGNGETQARSEWYDNMGNARRGAWDLLRSLQEVAAEPPEDE